MQQLIGKLKSHHPDLCACQHCGELAFLELTQCADNATLRDILAEVEEELRTSKKELTKVHDGFDYVNKLQTVDAATLRLQLVNYLLWKMDDTPSGTVNVEKGKPNGNLRLMKDVQTTNKLFEQ